MKVTTFINSKPFQWEVEGDFKWGDGGPLYNVDKDLTQTRVGADGYFVTTLPQGFADFALNAITRFLGEFNLTPARYHFDVDDDMHQQVISRSRQLRMTDLGWDGELLCRELSVVTGFNLSLEVPDLGRDHVQVRINRPNKTDFNPPHRDGALSIWRNTLNLWIPIFGCDERTCLPVAPGSHLIAESDCLQTAAGGARIGGRTYNVPAIVRHRAGDWNMIRPPVQFGEALVFTPFLVHGAGVNMSDGTRIALELRLTIQGQQYPKV